MCLILLAHDQHPQYRLVVAANRDEYYQRPSAALSWWTDHPSILAGRDLSAGGTWMGITRSGRFAAVTNYREPGRNQAQARSRGELVSDFLLSGQDARQYLATVGQRADRYNGFNLIAGTVGHLSWLSNRAPSPQDLGDLGPGVYGLSNHLLDTPWPKLERGKAMLTTILERVSDEQELVTELLGLLSDRSQPPDQQLPDTGVGIELERLLSPIFIHSPHYGTRSSQVLLISRQGHVTLVEQAFTEAGPAQAPVSFRFSC